MSSNSGMCLHEDMYMFEREVSSILECVCMYLYVFGSERDYGGVLEFLRER